MLKMTLYQGPVFTIQIDPEGDIVTGGGKDGRIVATNPDGEILDETSLSRVNKFDSLILNKPVYKLTSQTV